MNNAKMWLVVSPTIGVPVFLGAVAIGSFAVHLQVVKNTDWVSSFMQGDGFDGAEMASATQLNEGELKAGQATYVMPTGNGMEVTVILPDGTSAVGILNMPETMASHQTDQTAPSITQ